MTQIPAIFKKAGEPTAVNPAPPAAGTIRDRDGRWIGGSPGQWAEELTGAVLEHGAAGFMLFSPPGGTPDITSLTRWGQEIGPAIRQAIAKEPGRQSL